jgi:hypothetical protein
MATVTFNIISGYPLFTAVLTPVVGPPIIKSNLLLGYNFISGVPQGDNYTLTITDAHGCTDIIIEIDILYLDCSATDIFIYASSSIVINNLMFIGERNIDPYIVRFNDPDDLSDYTREHIAGVGDLSIGLESVCYSSSTGRLYFAARDNASGNLSIIEIDPITFPVYIKHVIGAPSPITINLAVIVTDGIYIYGASDIEFFKIRISDWSVIQTYTYLLDGEGFTNAGAIAININRDQFYVTSTGIINKLAIVSMSDISSTSCIELGVYISNPSDDICYYDSGGTYNVYIAGQTSVTNYGAAYVDVDTQVVTGIKLSPSYGLWIYCTKVYSAAINETIETFDISNTTLVNVYPLDETGFIANEIMFIGNRSFITKWGGTGVAKLCEYICLPVNCTTTSTTSSTSTSTTTTSTTTIEPTTTTTTTDCFIYSFYPCGKYTIENPTSEYRQFSYRDCGEVSWMGTITMSPFSVYISDICREYSTFDCYLELVLTESCVSTTTTTTTTEPTTTTTTTLNCWVEGFIICDYTTTTSTTIEDTTTTTTTEEITTTTTTTTCPCNDAEITTTSGVTYGIANTWGSYCGLTQEQYIAQTFILPGPGTITRVGIRGWKEGGIEGVPSLTIQCILLSTHLYGGRPIGGCPTVTAADYPDIDIYTSNNTIKFEGTAPGSPQWYYFCFDNAHFDSGGPWAISFYYPDILTDVNDADNYVQFCTGTDYADGHYAYKISPENTNAYGIPEVTIDLSCKICYNLDTTTTTTTTEP